MTDWKCKKCGGTEKYKVGGCKNCAKLRAERNRHENPEKTRAAVRSWVLKNKDAKKQSDTRWRTENRERYNANKREYRANHLEQKREQSKRHYIRHREKKLAAQAAYILAHPERKKLASDKWKGNNKHMLRIYSHTRRARKLEAGGKLSHNISKRLFALQNGRCACCGAPLGERYHLDHIMPLALGGSNSDDNVQLLTPKCNQSKSAKHPIDFMQSRGYLL